MQVTQDEAKLAEQVREMCAVLCETDRIVSGSLGPLMNEGFSMACRHHAKAIRALDLSAFTAGADKNAATSIRSDDAEFGMSEHLSRDYCESCGYTDSHDPNCPRENAGERAPERTYDPAHGGRESEPVSPAPDAPAASPDTRYQCQACGVLLGGKDIYGTGWHKRDGIECGPTDLRPYLATKDARSLRHQSGETPETDAFHDKWDSYNFPMEAIEFARYLERRLREAEEESKDYQARYRESLENNLRLRNALDSFKRRLREAQEDANRNAGKAAEFDRINDLRQQALAERDSFKRDRDVLKETLGENRALLLERNNALAKAMDAVTFLHNAESERDSFKRERDDLLSIVNTVMAIPNMTDEQLDELQANCRAALAVRQPEGERG